MAPLFIGLENISGRMKTDFLIIQYYDTWLFPNQDKWWNMYIFLSGEIFYVRVLEKLNFTLN